jgi:hypothetical protein
MTEGVALATTSCQRTTTARSLNKACRTCDTQSPQSSPSAAGSQPSAMFAGPLAKAYLPTNLPNTRAFRAPSRAHCGSARVPHGRAATAAAWTRVARAGRLRKPGKKKTYGVVSSTRERRRPPARPHPHRATRDPPAQPLSAERSRPTELPSTATAASAIRPHFGSQSHLASWRPSWPPRAR